MSVLALRPLAPCLGALALVAGLAACSAPRGPVQWRPYPGALQPPAELGVEGVWRQYVTASWETAEGERDERGFDAAVQVRGDELTVIGLSPIGQPGFVLRFDGVDTLVENNTDDELPIPARYVLLDVQRVLYPRIPNVTGVVDGEVTAVSGEERVGERYVGGRLVERRFERTDATPAGAIVVRYEYGEDEWFAPTRALLDNGWFGYRLEVVTHEETLLESGPVH